MLLCWGLWMFPPVRNPLWPQILLAKPYPSCKVPCRCQLFHKQCSDSPLLPISYLNQVKWVLSFPDFHNTLPVTFLWLFSVWSSSYPVMLFSSVPRWYMFWRQELVPLIIEFPHTTQSIFLYSHSRSVNIWWWKKEGTEWRKNNSTLDCTLPTLDAISPKALSSR